MDSLSLTVRTTLCWTGSLSSPLVPSMPTMLSGSGWISEEVSPIGLLACHQGHFTDPEV
jgi:hypothetical protein